MVNGCPILPLLPFTYTRADSINANSLKLQLLTARKKDGGRPRRTAYPRRLPVNCIYIPLYGLDGVNLTL